MTDYEIKTIKRLAHEAEEKSLFWFAEMHKHKRGSEEYNTCDRLSAINDAKAEALREALTTIKANT